MSSILPSPDAQVVDDLARALQLLDAPVTIRPQRMPDWAWKCDFRDPAHPRVLIGDHLDPGVFRAALAGALAEVARKAREHVRPTLRALPGAGDPTAPVRPTLRALPGGAR